MQKPIVKIYPNIDEAKAISETRTKPHPDTKEMPIDEWAKAYRSKDVTSLSAEVMRMNARLHERYDDELKINWYLPMTKILLSMIGICDNIEWRQRVASRHASRSPMYDRYRRYLRENYGNKPIL